MCVHLFVAVSSPSCANYALRQSPLAVTEFGKEAADTVENNFYVDDMPRSADDINSAKRIVDNTIGICVSGGFKLDKFVCNEQEVVECA